MDFVVVIGIFVLFVAGMVLAIQGFIGKEVNPQGQPFAMAIDLEHPGIAHPKERHRGRLLLIGGGLMALAIALGLVLL